MPWPLTVRKPRRPEIDYLNTVLEQELTAGQRRRAEVLMLYAAGLEGTDIARALDIHVNTVYADLKAFERDGLDCVHHRWRGGAPLRIAEAQRAQILRLRQVLKKGGCAFVTSPANSSVMIRDGTLSWRVSD
jgi:hypothetical protein